MALEKPIEILEDLLGEGPQYPPDDRRDAVKLGIEGLKRLQRLRSDKHCTPMKPLPGEAKD